ncbi:leucine-rich repeat-containing protein 56 isoform X2 [Oryctolagus cuniculus]|uniref:leucine-rich repeat-containing protein 56 isoform X2 n=1 Tax=Oryctolagus cuniculus TaxID=9986 RepID=UPI00387A4E9F
MQMRPRPVAMAPGPQPRGRKNWRSRRAPRPRAPRAEPRAGHPGAPQRALAGEDDLQLVRVLEMCVDTRESSLGNFGVHLPSLNQLKLNGSRLGSLRDLGSSLGRLQVLWLARCGLADLDGVGSMPALKELFVSYNNISDLSPLCLLEHLEVLDLEGNSVEDLGQVGYLRLCPRLATLTLEGNLVCLRPDPGPASKAPPGYNYRAAVRRLVPQLQLLDEVPATHTGLPAPPKLDQDWLMVKEAIKEASVLPWLDGHHGAAVQSLDLELSLSRTRPWAPRHLPSSSLVPEGPLADGLPAEELAPDDHASNLTLGAGRVLCGNPTRGLWERRQQCQAWTSPEQPPQCRPEEPAAGTPSPRPGPQPQRHPGLCHPAPKPWHLPSQQRGAAAPRGPWRVPEQQDGQAGPKTSSSPLSPASEPSRSLGGDLTPSPPKHPPGHPPGSAGLPFRGRRLRALTSLGPGLGPGMATVTALRALEVASGPGPPCPGRPDPQAAPDPAARARGLQCLRPLNPITPAPSRP